MDTHVQFAPNLALRFEKCVMHKPQIWTGEEMRALWPQECRMLMKDYVGNLYAEVVIFRTDTENREEIMRSAPMVVAVLPVMVGSVYCHTHGVTDPSILLHSGECPTDRGNYFIMNGVEYVIDVQERLRINLPLAYFDKGSPTLQMTCLSARGPTSRVILTPSRKVTKDPPKQTDGIRSEIMVRLICLQNPVNAATLLLVLGVRSIEQFWDIATRIYRPHESPERMRAFQKIKLYLSETLLHAFQPSCLSSSKTTVVSAAAATIATPTTATTTMTTTTALDTTTTPTTATAMDVDNADDSNSADNTKQQNTTTIHPSSSSAEAATTTKTTTVPAKPSSKRNGNAKKEQPRTFSHHIAQSEPLTAAEMLTPEGQIFMQLTSTTTTLYFKKLGRKTALSDLRAIICDYLFTHYYLAKDYIPSLLTETSDFDDDENLKNNDGVEARVYMLVMLILRIVETRNGFRKPDDRDAFGRKRLDAAGKSIEILFLQLWASRMERKVIVKNSNDRRDEGFEPDMETLYRRMCLVMKQQREATTAETMMDVTAATATTAVTTEDFETAVAEADLTTFPFERMLAEADISQAIGKTVIHEGWQFAFRQTKMMMRGYTKQDTKRKNIIERKVRTNIRASTDHMGYIAVRSDPNSKTVQPRMVQLDQIGGIDPSRTPENESVGFNKNTAFTVRLSRPHLHLSDVSRFFKHVRLMRRVRQTDGNTKMELHPLGSQSQSDPIIWQCVPPPRNDLSDDASWYCEPFMFNGCFIGWCDGIEMRKHLIEARRQQKLWEDMLVMLDDDRQLQVFTDDCRMLRPLLVVECGEVLALHRVPEVTAKLRNFKTTPLTKDDWLKLEHAGCVDYVDTWETNSSFFCRDVETGTLLMNQDAWDREFEEDHCELNDRRLFRNPCAALMIAPSLWEMMAKKEKFLATSATATATATRDDNDNDDDDNNNNDRRRASLWANRYTHCEVDPLAIFCITTSSISRVNFIQGPRVQLANKFNGQGMGTYHCNQYGRMDSQIRAMIFPTQTCHSVATTKHLGTQQLPIGRDYVLAIKPDNSENQEDAVVINRTLPESGATDYFFFYEETLTEHNEDGDGQTVPIVPTKRNPNGLVFGLPSIRCFSGTSMMNSDTFTDNFSHISNHGLPKPGVFVSRGMALIGAYSTDPQGNQHDKTLYVRKGHEGIVDHVTMGFNATGHKQVRVRVLQHRSMIVGDKVTDENAQKTTCSQQRSPAHMVYDPETGIMADGVVNTHCMPSRMTLNKTGEILSSTLAVCQGVMYDSSAFRDNNYEAQMRALTYFGLDATCTHRLINPRTGELMTTSTFMGLERILQSKHIGSEKNQCRGSSRSGPNDPFTGQPVGGGSRDGATRVGEMERDMLIMHGVMQFIRESFCAVADYYEVYVCSNPSCGRFITPTDEEVCHYCSNKSNDLASQLLAFLRKLPHVATTTPTITTTTATVTAPTTSNVASSMSSLTMAFTFPESHTNLHMEVRHALEFALFGHYHKTLTHHVNDLLSLSRMKEIVQHGGVANINIFHKLLVIAMYPLATGMTNQQLPLDPQKREWLITELRTLARKCHVVIRSEQNKRRKQSTYLPHEIHRETDVYHYYRRPFEMVDESTARRISIPYCTKYLHHLCSAMGIHVAVVTN
jgi:DNA-directed RNA polymerase beta subunit